MGTTVYTSCCALKNRNQYSPPNMRTTARPPDTQAAPEPIAYIMSDESASRVMRRLDTRIMPYAQYTPLNTMAVMKKLSHVVQKESTTPYSHWKLTTSSTVYV